MSSATRTPDPARSQRDPRWLRPAGSFARWWNISEKVLDAVTQPWLEY